MGTERGKEKEREMERNVSLFDAVDETRVSDQTRNVSLFDLVDEDELAKSNGIAVHGNSNMTPLINRWNGRPYSLRYYEMLEKRKTLPVWDQKEEFLQALHANQTLILVGEPGSGETTQIPQFVLEAVDIEAPDKRRKFMIGCTQPCTLTTVSASRGVAEEMDVTIEEEVGYSIRFNDCSSGRTVLK